MTARRDVPEIANHSPHVVLEWSRWHSALTAEDVVRVSAREIRRSPSWVKGSAG